jgi:hypothetical protein
MAIKHAELQGAAGQAERKALAFLITADWLEGDAAAQGVRVSPSEVESSYHELASGPTGSAFVASLKRRGMSSGDELLVLRLGALAEKLRAKVIGPTNSSPAARQRKVQAFLAAYRQRWKLLTTCSPGHVVAECRSGPPLSG